MLRGSPQKILLPDSKLVLVPVNQTEFDRVSHEAYQRCGFPASYTEALRREEFESFNDALEAALGKHFRSGHDLGGDYFLNDDWNGNQSHSAGLYGEHAHCLEFLDTIHTAIQAHTKLPREWHFHIACECHDEDKVPWGEVLIHDGSAYITAERPGALVAHFRKRKVKRSFQNLCDAVRRGKTEDVKKFLSGDADVSKPDRKGNRPIHYARTVEIAKLLVDAGADLRVEDEYGKWPVDNTSEHYADNALFHFLYDRTYPLHGAAKANDLPRIRELAGGMDVNSFDRDETYTPLHHAARAGHLEAIEILLQLGADINRGSKYQWTPLGHALSLHQAVAAEYLLKRGAKPSARDVFAACPQPDARCLELLATHGCDLNMMNENGETPLHWVRSPACAQLLIQHGVPVNAQNKPNGYSALHHASMNGDIEMVKVLLDAGADARLLDKNGEPALNHALKYDPENPKRKEVAELLRSHAASG